MMKIFKKITASLMTLVMALSVTLPAVPATAQTTTKSIGNDYLTFSVNGKTGFFNIKTLEGHPQKAADNNMNLLYAGDSVETSFTTVRVDGKDYIFGQDYGIFNLKAKPGETTVDAVNNTVSTEWTVDGVKIIQKAYLSRTDNTFHSGNISLEYYVENTDTKPHSVGIRVMMDNALGSNDAPTPMVESEIAPITKESQFFEGGRNPGDYIRYVDNFELPTKEEFFMFDNLMSDEPDKMIVGHWLNLASSKWTLSPDENLAFTSGFNKYETVDTATALYWNEEEVSPGANYRKTLLYGVGDFSEGGKKSNFDVTIELDDSGLVIGENGLYVDDIVDVKITVYNNVDGSEDLDSPRLDLTCENGAFFLYEKEGSDLTGFQNITDLIGRIEKGTIATFDYELVVEEPEVLKTIDVVATLTGNTEDSKSSVRKYVFARAPQKGVNSFSVSEMGRTKFHKSGNRTMLLKGAFDTELLEDRTKWSLAFVNESDPSIRYEVPTENILLNSADEMSVLYGNEMVVGKYKLEFAFFEEFKEVFGETYEYKSIEIVDDANLIMNKVQYLGVYRENYGSASLYKVDSFASKDEINKKAASLGLHGGEMLLVVSSDEGAMFDIEYDSEGKVTGYVAVGDVTINDVAVAEKGTRIAPFKIGTYSGVSITGKDALYSAQKKQTLFDCDWKIVCDDGFQFSLTDKSLKLEADGVASTYLTIAMGLVNLQAGVFGKNAKGYTISYSGTVNILGYTPVAEKNKEKYAENKYARVGFGLNLSAAIDNVLFDKNGFVGIDTTFKASFVSTNIIGCAQMDVFAAEVGVDTISGKYDLKFTVTIKKKLTVSAGAGLKEVSINDSTTVLPSSFNINFAVTPESAVPFVPGVFGLYMLGIDLKDMTDLVSDYSQANTPEERRLMVNQATTDITISAGFVLFKVILLNGIGSFGTNHARIVLNGTVLKFPGLTLTVIFSTNWKVAIHDHDGNLLTPEQFSLLLSGELNVFDIFKGTLSFSYSSVEPDGGIGELHKIMIKLYGALYVPKLIPIIGGISIFGAGGTLTDTGIDVSVTLLGTDVGFSCDWDGNVNWDLTSAEGSEEMPELAPNNMRMLQVKRPDAVLMSAGENYVSGTIDSVPGHTTLIGVNYFGNTPSYDSFKLMVDGKEQPLVKGSNDSPDGNIYILPDNGEGGRIIIGIPEMAEGEHNYTLTTDSDIRMAEMEAVAFAKMANASEISLTGNGSAVVKSDSSLKGSTVELYYVKDKDNYDNIKVEEYTDDEGNVKVRTYKEEDGKKVELDEDFYKKLSEHLLVSEKVSEDTKEVVLTPETRYDVKSGSYYVMALVRSPYGKISRCITDAPVDYVNVNQPETPKGAKLVNAGNGTFRVDVDDADNADYDGYFVKLYNVTDQKYVVENQYFDKDEEIRIEFPYVESGKVYRSEVTSVNVIAADAFSESGETVKSAEIALRTPEIIAVDLKLDGEHPEGDYTDFDGNTYLLPYVSERKATLKAVAPKNVKGRFVTDNTPGEWSSEAKSDFVLNLSELSAGSHTVIFEAMNEHGDISSSLPVTFAVAAGAPSIALDSDTVTIENGKITFGGKTNSAEKVTFMDKEYPVSDDGRFEISTQIETNRYVESCSITATGFDGQKTTTTFVAVNPDIKPIDSVVLKADGKDIEEITLNVGDKVKFEALGSAGGETRDMGSEISVIVHEGNSVASLDSEYVLTATAPGTAFVKASWNLGSRIDGEKTRDYVFEDMVRVTVLKKSEPVVSSIPDGATITTDDKLTLEGDGEIYYTLDGSEPTENSARYTGPIKLPKGDITVKVIVIKDGYGASDVTTLTYKVKKDSSGSSSGSGKPDMIISGGGSSDKLNPDSGPHKVNYGYPLVITAPNGVVYYTLDGTTPDRNSKKYDEPIRITRDMKVRAVVWTEGDIYSDVMTYDMKLNGYDIYLRNDLEKGNLIKGYEDSTFRPDKAITRAETASILRRSSEMYGYYIDENMFSDIDMWAKKEISELASADIVKGYGDGTFKPDNAVTRAEFVTMLMRIIDNYGKSAPFADVEGHWAEMYIAKAYEYGYIKGYEDGTFRPDNTITRAEAITIISEVFGFDANGKETNFTDVTSDHWAFGYIAK